MFSDLPISASSLIDVDGVRSGEGLKCRHGAFVAPTHAIEEAGRGGWEGIRRRGTRRLRTAFVERVPGGWRMDGLYLYGEDGRSCFALVGGGPVGVSYASRDDSETPRIGVPVGRSKGR